MLHLLLLRICFYQLKLVPPLLPACSSSKIRGRTQTASYAPPLNSFLLSSHVHTHPLASAALFFFYGFHSTNPQRLGQAYTGKWWNPAFPETQLSHSKSHCMSSRSFKLLLYLLRPSLSLHLPSLICVPDLRFACTSLCSADSVMPQSLVQNNSLFQEHLLFYFFTYMTSFIF